MRIRNILTTLFVSTILVACGGNDYSPKPQAYLRIDTPEAHYVAVDSLPLPFLFEMNDKAELSLKKNTGHEIWLDINYPQWSGVVFLTYKHLRGVNDLRGQTDTSTRMLEKHYQFASGIDEQVFESDDHTVHAVKWHLKGKNVASTYQFYATDSVHHFLRGALFINHAPNNDSLAPVLDYMHRDLDHLIETLRWR
jgi:gliding motility-associated lipoprotein GldD